MNADNMQGKLTIGDVAKALGISKTTVSRAISGKGRIGASTRQRVLEYIEENNYIPNPIAKGLAQSKTYNICWVMPGDPAMTDLPFFLRCMNGIADVATPKDYDILTSMIYNENISQLKRVVNNRKVDGVILGRTLLKDECICFLKESQIPFVVIGSTGTKGVVQIDNDHVRACREMTSILVMKGIKKFAFICGDMNHVVTNTRKRGFDEGINQPQVSPQDVSYYLDCKTGADVERAVDAALYSQTECLVCADDWICGVALNKLQKDEIRIPDQIKIVSFYNSQLIANAQPAITALQYDPKELGMVACQTLFSMIEGEQVKEKVLLGYELLLTDSTQMD